MNRKITCLAILLFIAFWGCAHPSKEVKKKVTEKPKKQVVSKAPAKKEEKN